MATIPVTVTLESSGGTATTAPGTLQHFTLVQRVLRAGVVLLIGVGAAAMLIPIPIIHLIGIPLALLVSCIAASRQLISTARLHSMRLPCPTCGGMNRIGGGLGYRRRTDPVDINCECCRRGLTLRCRENDPVTKSATLPR